MHTIQCIYVVMLNVILNTNKNDAYYVMNHFIYNIKKSIICKHLMKCIIYFKWICQRFLARSLCICLYAFEYASFLYSVVIHHLQLHLGPQSPIRSNFKNDDAAANSLPCIFASLRFVNHIILCVTSK